MSLPRKKDEFVPRPTGDADVIGFVGEPDEDARRGAAGHPDASQSVRAWLDVFARLLELPEAERAEIRDELAEHLDERVRDLLLGGATEREAVERAIGELGDAALLARRFRSESQRAQRRPWMNIAAIGVAGVALATSVMSGVMLRGGGGAGASASQPAAIAAAAGQASGGGMASGSGPSGGGGEAAAVNVRGQAAQEIERALFARGQAMSAGGVAGLTYPGQYAGDDRVPAVKVHADSSMPLAAFLSAAAQQAGMKAVVRSQQIEETLGWPANATLGTVAPGEELDGLTLADAMGVLNEQVDATKHDRLECRVKGGRLVFGPQSLFDRQEPELTAYDLAPVVAARAEREGLAEQHAEDVVIQEVSKLAMSIVDSELWRDNGGDRAEMFAYGSTLFVKAPRRMQTQVRFVLGRVLKDSGADEAIEAHGQAMRAELDALLARGQAIELPRMQEHVAKQQAELAERLRELEMNQAGGSFPRQSGPGSPDAAEERAAVQRAMEAERASSLRIPAHSADPFRRVPEVRMEESPARTPAPLRHPSPVRMPETPTPAVAPAAPTPRVD